VSDRMKLLWFAALLGIQCVCAAFEGDEHEALGQMASRVALRELERSCRNEAGKERAIQFLKHLTDDRKTNATYGRIIRAVDYLKDNYPLLHSSATSSGWPADPTVMEVRLPSMSSFQNFVGATHLNHDHFQGRLLYSYWFWHRQAVEIAAEGNLWAALLMNAYADHFLQDMFAPGHLAAPRDEGSHDLHALMLHDHFNKNGLIYRLNSPRACSNAVVRLKTYALGSEDSLLKLNLKREDLERIGTWEGPLDVHCHGDNRLNQDSLQVAVVLAFCVQSIWDVIESNLSNHAINSFRHYRWKLDFAVPEGVRKVLLGQIETFDVWLSFGDLICLNVPDTETLAPDLPIKEGTGRKETFADLRTDTNTVILLGKGVDKNPAWGFSLGMQNLQESQGSHLRTLLEVERLVWGARVDYLDPSLAPKWEPNLWAITLSASGIWHPDGDGYGLGGRIILPFPKANFQISLLGGMRYYLGNRFEGFGDFEGVRAEWGLHLANFFVGLGHDRHPRSDGTLANGLAVEAGISLALPLSRCEVPLQKVGDWLRR
jgi:hypothetical protein